MKIHKYNNMCWWCGAKADSREHKYKKSELVQECGAGPYKGQRALIRITPDKDHKIQGPGSNQVKYKKNICHNCNNAKSQDFDIAYETFITFIKKNEEIIISNQTFSFCNIYGKEWQKHVENLKRYYIKFICCRLAEADVLVHPAIIRYLDGKNTLKYFSMHMSIMRDVLIMKQYFLKNVSPLGISHGDLKCIMNIKKSYLRNIQSYYQYRWLRISYCYDRTISNPKDNFSKESVYLPIVEEIGTYNILFQNKNIQPCN